ncbi:MAG: polyribonucleotide nucleotidyltransferase [Alphaproteobacteria bacterium]|nr:polyribonucleotide nucleotidyltransferase [Alphaproteobacteria bacterium]MDA7988672.1 polyribonucleotide nucleotidyltransferase [Alphaproteobacteria bacterium]
MFKIAKQEIEWAGRPLTLETGRLARQADGAVLATYGETVVLATAVGEREPRPGLDFFPLTVHYQEKTSAAGKIPGGFFKREGRPSEKEILTSRLIDRPIRPLFHKEFRNETQVICTVLSHDLENDPDIVAIVAASAALTISGLPFFGPVAAARIGFQDGEYIINPTLAETEESRLDLVVAATAEGVLMVESEADELSEEIMLDAVLEGHKAMKPVLDAVVALAESAAREPRDIPPPPARREELAASLARDCESQVRDAYAVTDKLARRDKIAAVKTAAAEKLATEEGDDALLAAAFKSLESRVVRGSILDGNPRIDGRKNDEIREIVCETGILPRTHGSALFTRGETQALVTATLGTGQDEQIVDDLAGEHRQAFLLHYNFPPYSVNETGRFGFTSRREVGHGKLAWRALHPLLPGKEDFPYTIRLISEITESNGSSSMATVCGSSLALMDAAVPLKTPVAGIAMGLISEGERYAVLSDILGDEDHLGDMDFKVAGTVNGVTSLQMDIKITSITAEIMKVALEQAHHGRLHILGKMNEALEAPREELAAHAPKIETLTVPREKIRDVIGTGGKVIRELCEVTGAKIDIEDDGTVRVAAPDTASVEDAVSRIQDIVAEPELHVVYDGTVVKVMEFGAFVNFLGQRDGLVHISQLTEGRVGRTEDVVREGDEVKVQVIGFDDRGKVKLSMRTVDQESGEIIAEPDLPPSRDRGDRGDRGRPRDRDRDSRDGPRRRRPRY